MDEVIAYLERMYDMYRVLTDQAVLSGDPLALTENIFRLEGYESAIHDAMRWRKRMQGAEQ
jgi:hypothetical protein